jgi:tRNA dimethylallyltransferase
MQYPDGSNPLILIVGPTGVGKSEIALQLAECLEGEIVSADSRLFYRGMDIGTAKPSLEELKRIPHHLIDVTNPDETWSLALFQEKAREAISGIHARHHLPFLVGGTGQFIRAVTDGWQPPIQPPDFKLRIALERWAEEIGPVGLYQRMASLDPQAAAKIDPNNLRRTIRALEVIFTTGEKFSAQRTILASPYRLFQVGLSRPRPELYTRIDERIDKMLACGFLNEVRHLVSLGYSPDLPSLSAIGYRELIDYLFGRATLAEAVVLIKRRTHRYVRRQANWFKPGDPDIHWFEVRPTVENEIEILIRHWMDSLDNK